MRYGLSILGLAAQVLAFTSCRQATDQHQSTGASTASSPTESSVQLPRFSSFPVTDTGPVSPAPLKFGRDTLARRFRTVLQEGARRGPNFAGQFTIIGWGCGSSCQMNAVVDARSGRIFQPWIQTMMAADYRRNSNLFIADPPDSALAAFGDAARSEKCAVCGTPAAYVWRGDHFEPTGNGDHPHITH